MKYKNVFLNQVFLFITSWRSSLNSRTTTFGGYKDEFFVVPIVAYRFIDTYY